MIMNYLMIVNTLFLALISIFIRFYSSKAEGLLDTRALQ